MKIEELEEMGWIIVPTENFVDGCELKCPTCKKWAVHTEWKESTVQCDICGDHIAMRCPNCFKDFDSVFSETFECIKETN